MTTNIPILPNCIDSNFSLNELKEIASKAKDWAVLHGIGMRQRTNFNEDSICLVPFVLLPSTFPRSEFNKAVEIQTVLNELMHKVAHDKEFLTESLKETIQVDEFTGNLFKIYETVYSEGINQPLSLGLLRSDIMLEGSVDDKNALVGSNCYRVKQVEFNTMASGFGWLGPASSMLHRYVLEELGHHEKLINIPDNNALVGLCNGMIDAWKIYGKIDAVILFVVEDVTYNICDQRFHEFEIRKLEPRAKVLRRNLTQIAANARLNDSNELVLEGHIVSVVYFRCAYEPNQFPSKKEWDARLLIERSLAIKSPSIQYHLAGTKKVQQILAKPNVLERFISDKRKLDEVKEIFTGLYGLDFDEAGDQAVQMALDDPERFVLKPQREGGGNNIYGTEIRDAMLKMKDSKERSGWILMERIRPPVSQGYVVRPGGTNPPPLLDLVSELGIFGVLIGDSEKIIINRSVGHMLRTKTATANEGGVAAGLGALDSPYLID